MPYILTADWHCHVWSQFSTVGKSGVNSRLAHILDEIERMAKSAALADIRRIYVAGDVFHVRGSVKPSVLNPLIETLRSTVSEFGVEWRIMPGNHDLEGKESEELGSAIMALGEIEGVTVIHEPTFFADDKVAMIPWASSRECLTKDIEEMRAALRLNVEDPAEYDLLLHTGINGVLIGVPDHGWYAKELAQFGFRRVFAGHYHNHKVFTFPSETPTEEIISIGALTHQTWSDVGTDAGWLAVRAGSVEFNQSSASQFMDFDPDFSGSYRGNYVRVQGLELEEDEIRVLREHLEKDGAVGVVVHAVAKSKAVRRDAASATKGASIESSIINWIKCAELPEPEKVEKLATEILIEARGA